MTWYIYIPEEGDWPINYDGDNLKAAKAAYLKWAGRKRLPAGAVVWSSERARLRLSREQVATDLAWERSAQLAW